MSRTEHVAMILKGASFWADWTYLNYYAAQVGSSDLVKQMAKDCEIAWRNWRDCHETIDVERAQALARIASDIVTVTRGAE